ncbi:ABC transporter substrate-binding protein [Natrarchaeobius sp. A-rgal3]|uniref:ABC transporter substrate-binding protein n=1 Tax=Natrarchaeobius versutus TaxID=1679078 RepID=UPI00350EF1E8
MPTDANRTSRASRRDVIRLGALGTAAMVAGCSSQEPEDEEGLNGDEDAIRFRTDDRDYAAPEDRHFNPFNPSGTAAWYPGRLVFDKMAVYSAPADEIFPMIVEDYSKPDDDTLEVEIRDDWVWHNGDPVVVEDWTMQVEINNALIHEGEVDIDDPDAGPFVQDIEVVDDHFARLSLRDPLSEHFTAIQALARPPGEIHHGVFTKHDDDTWSEWHEQIVHGDGDERMSGIEDAITTPYPEITDHPIGNGPFEVATIGDDEIVCEVFDDHPYADDIEIDEFSIHHFEDPIQAYLQENVDASHSGWPAPPDLQEQMPPGSELISEDLSHNNLITFNCGYDVDVWDTPFESREVRQAVAHVFDKEGLATLAEGTEIEVFEFPPCRVPHGALQEGVVDVSDFTEYGQNDTETATELLEGEGYSLEDGTWYTPDDEVFEISILGGFDNVVIQTLVANLNDFGIETVQEEVDDATFDERRMAGEYDIIPDGSSADSISEMWSLDLWDWISDLTHHSPEMTIPMPVGDPTGSDGEQTINVAEHLTEWRITNDEQYHRELMWAWNQHIPQAEMGFEPSNGVLNTGNGWELDARHEIKHGLDTVLFDVHSLPDGVLRRE